MKKIKRYFALPVAFLACALLAGCDAAYTGPVAAERPVAVALLLGNHACSKPLDLTAAPVQETVSQAVSSYGYLSVIRVDGDPQIVLEGSCDIDDRYKGADPHKLAQDAAARTGTLLAQLADVKAAVPEVDTLEALRLAARSFAEAPAEADRVVVVVDSGLSTTGLCDFTNNLLSGDAGKIADALVSREAIPDLTGVEVVWQQMGDVAAPQQELSPRQRNRLQEIWQAIIEAGGGTLTLSDAPPCAADADPTLPEVTPVSLAAETPVVYSPASVTGSDFTLDAPVFLQEEQVQFVGDSDAFLDKEAAVRVIEPFAAYLGEHPEQQLLLAGTTAGDENTAFSLTLSAARAQAVKEVLVSLGVEETRIRTLGLGCSDPWHIKNAGLQGDLAAQNRKVVLLDGGGALAQQLVAEAAAANQTP